MDLEGGLGRVDNEWVDDIIIFIACLEMFYTWTIFCLSVNIYALCILDYSNRVIWVFLI